MIRLMKINDDNFDKVVELKVKKDQTNYVATNIYSLAQAWLYYDHAKPYAIYNEDEVVGFIMFDYDKDERTLGVWRFMIGKEFQHKGYGKETLKKIIEEAIEDTNIDMVYLDYVKDNEIAKNLYYNLGFRENGKEEDGEIVMCLKVTDNPKVGLLMSDEEDIEDIKDIILKNDLNVDIDKIIIDIKNKKVSRLSLYGDTIGFIYLNCIYLDNKFSDKLEEVKEKIKK